GGVFFDDLDKIGECCPISEAQANAEALAQIRTAHMSAFSPAGQQFLAGLGGADAPRRDDEHVMRAG
ncbi:MAG: hypothetical protein P8X50_14100, partial [Maritimibacter sp.]